MNEIWISKNAASEREKQALEQKLAQRTQDCKRLDDQINKLREEDRMKDIFMKERDNALKEKSGMALTYICIYVSTFDLFLFIFYFYFIFILPFKPKLYC